MSDEKRMDANALAVMLVGIATSRPTPEAVDEIAGMLERTAGKVNERARAEEERWQRLYEDEVRAHADTQRSESALRAEVETLRAALTTIADPIDHLRRRAKSEGALLDGGAAVRLANDASWLKEIARAALHPSAPTPATATAAKKRGCGIAIEESEDGIVRCGLSEGGALCSDCRAAPPETTETRGEES
jgi:hypothetical protein